MTASARIPPPRKDLSSAPRPCPPPSEVFFASNPLAVGVPLLVAGAVTLGLKLINYAPVTGVPLAILVAAIGLGLLVATVWAAGLGQPVVAAMLSLSTRRLPSSFRAIFFTGRADPSARHRRLHQRRRQSAQGGWSLGVRCDRRLRPLRYRLTGGRWAGVPLGQPILRSGP